MRNWQVFLIGSFSKITNYDRHSSCTASLSLFTDAITQALEKDSLMTYERKNDHVECLPLSQSRLLKT